MDPLQTIGSFLNIGSLSAFTGEFYGLSTEVIVNGAQFFTVPRGQLTFDSEGIERAGSIYHSRAAHIPSSSSGITIGRGFDLGMHDAQTIRFSLSDAGFETAFIERAAGAAQLRGKSASAYLARHPFDEITPAQQWNLFNATYRFMELDVRRISERADTVARYGSVDWGALPLPVQDVLIDLRFRGDYTPQTRAVIQPLLARKDFTAFTELMGNSAYWTERRGVPEQRAIARYHHLLE